MGKIIDFDYTLMIRDFKLIKPDLIYQERYGSVRWSPG